MDTLVLRNYRPSDALAISQLFRTIYGDSYAQSHVYLPDMIHQNNMEGHWHSWVAVSGTRLLGHTALIRSDSPTAEVALSVIDPNFRGRNIATGLSRQLMIHAQAMGYQGLTMKQVTQHPYTQRMAAGLGFHSTGLLPDYAPSPFGKLIPESLVLAYTPIDGFQRPLPKIPWPDACRLLMQQMSEVFGLQDHVSPWVGAAAQFEQRWNRYDGVFKEVDASLFRQLQQLPAHWLISIRIGLTQDFPGAWQRMTAIGFVFTGLAPDDRGAGWLAMFHRGFQPKTLTLHCPHMQRLHDDIQRQNVPTSYCA
ncbi:GNAT family N-acetyltransferase [Pseudomonas koreensis]|uniref:GNAT family N-acetyltransferase n=1 Tax=Pseudomonas koreensis TaxID=198620 RepID=UPI0021CA5BC3|nr:GNAT family N-acetyltransferase [Pseudomonas koreensis]MCU0070329.1 GNAT family N-acetyltransferase [Pseudomonas koreensis]